MVQPIQYQIPGGADPFAGVLQGLKIGASLQELDAVRATQALKQQEIQAKLAQQQRMQDALTQFNTKPREQRTDADYETLGMLLPAEQSNALRQWFETKTKNDQERLKLDIGQTLTALRRDPSAAEQKLNLMAEAFRNKGDEQSANLYSSFAKAAKAAPLDTFDAVMGTFTGPFGKDWATSVLQADTGREKEGAALREARAKADKAVEDAKTAKANAATAADVAAADKRLKIAQADEAQVKARVAKFEEQLTGGVAATPEIRTAVAATKLPPNQKQALVELANVKAPKTVVQLGEEEEKKARARSLVKEYEGLRDTAVASKKLLGNLEVAENLLNKADFSTGFGTETKAAAASVLSALGVPQATQFATNAQTFLAQSREALLQKSILQKGTQTEGDAKRINETGAALGNTKDANKFILALAKTVAQRDIDKAKFYANYEREKDTLRGGDAAWEESPAGSKSIFDYPAMQPFRNIQPPPPAPAAPAAPAPAAPAAVTPESPPRRRVEGKVTPMAAPAQSFPVAPQPATPTESIDAMVDRWRSKYGVSR